MGTKWGPDGAYPGGGSRARRAAGATRRAPARDPEPSATPSLYAFGEERHASWLELFFDLVFVLSIAELARYLHDHPTPEGFLAFAAVLVPVWWAWLSFTYWADLFEVDGTLYRAAMLLAMLFALALSMNVYGAAATDGSDGPLTGASAGFAASFASMQVVLVGLYLWSWRSERAARPLSGRYAAGFSAGVLLWSASVFVGEPARFWLWGLALAVELATPPFAQLVVLAGRVAVQVSHLSERLGLFALIVLGESIVVTGAGVAETDWRPSSVLVAVLGFAAVGCLWWVYFDYFDEGATERAFAGGRRELLAGIVWSYGHLSLFAALAATAVGLELAIAEAGHHALASGARVALCGGVALYLLTVSVLHPLSPTPPPRRVLASRLLAAGLSLALIAVGGRIPPTAVAGVLALALVALVGLETRAAPPSAHSIPANVDGGGALGGGAEGTEGPAGAGPSDEGAR